MHILFLCFLFVTTHHLPRFSDQKDSSMRHRTFFKGLFEKNIVVSFTAYGSTILMCAIVEISDFFDFLKRLMHKTYLFSLQIRIPPANALKR